MTKDEREQIEALLSNPDMLLKKRPFFRKVSQKSGRERKHDMDVTGFVTAQLPDIEMTPVSQAQFMRELDVDSHDVLFDDNIPSITVKLNDGGYLDMKQHRMAVPFQKLIRNKQVRHLCVNTMSHTLLNTNPTDAQKKNFIRFKQGWVEKNMEGAKTKFVQDQKSYGDAGLLFFIKNGVLRTKNINYADGYVIISHKDDSGAHILECLYYAVTDADGNSTTYLDCYDDEKMTRFTNKFEAGTGEINGWVRHPAVEHGFSECPLVTKRGEVAWNNGQTTITSYEALYNTFVVIEKRHGWGALYLRGKINQNGQKIAGAVVINDTSGDEHADAKYLTPPSPQNMIETLELMEQTIMKSCGTTFILPKDIKISGDTSGLAVEMTQELDMATAQDGVIEWQNAANKMSRLFKEGLAIELVRSGEKDFGEAITEFDDMRILTEFRVWKPKSEEGHNQMLATLKGAGGISQQTLVEKNTVSTPDEMARIQREHEEQLREQEERAIKAAELAQSTSEQTVVSEKD